MARTKKDPNLATVSYNAQSVERSIGYTTALINVGEKSYDVILSEVVEYYDLSMIESAMVRMGTTNLVAPQFRNKSDAIPESLPLVPLVEKVAEIVEKVEPAKASADKVKTAK